MADDLDDFELERTRKDARRPGEDEPLYRPEPEDEPLYTAADEEKKRLYRPAAEPKASGRLFPLTVAVLAVVAIAVLAVLFFVFRTPQTKAPAKAAAAPPATAAPSPVPEATPEMAAPSPLEPLPPLESSDDAARQAGAGLSSHPEMKRWLAQPNLVRALAASVSNVADGDTPRPHLGFLAPSQRFRAARRDGRTVPDPASFAGYDRFADAVASVDARAAAAAFARVEPLFEAAYRELGHPEGGFRGALLRAIDALLAVPVLPEDVELVPHAIGFRYVDPSLEGLSDAQKQFLRIGPRNVRIVQEKLRQLRPALARG